MERKRERIVLKISSCINPFQPSVAFDIETSHLFGSTKQMTGFYMKSNIVGMG